MNVWKILAIIFLSLLDLSKLHELENEFLEILDELNKQKDLDSIVNDGEEFVNQQSGSNHIKIVPKAISRCKVDASVLQQDILGLTNDVLQTTLPNIAGDKSNNDIKRFTSNVRNQIQKEKNIVSTAEESTRNLFTGGKDLKLILGSDMFREMIIVNRIKNLHNLWFLSDLNSDQIIKYIKLMISSLNNKGMFISVCHTFTYNICK